MVPAINGLLYFIIYSTVVACNQPLPSIDDNEVAPINQTSLGIAAPFPSVPDECLDEHLSPVPVAFAYPQSEPFVPAPHVLAPTPGPPLTLPRLPPLLPEHKPVHSPQYIAPLTQTSTAAPHYQPTAVHPPALPIHPLPSATPGPFSTPAPTPHPPVTSPADSIKFHPILTPNGEDCDPVHHPDTKIPDTKIPDTKIPDTKIPTPHPPVTSPADSIKFHPTLTPFLYPTRGANGEDCDPVHHPDTKIPDTKIPDTKIADTKIPDNSFSNHVEPAAPSAPAHFRPPTHPPAAPPLPELLPLLSSGEKFVPAATELARSHQTFLQPYIAQAPTFVGSFKPSQTYGLSFVHLRPATSVAPSPIPHHQPGHTSDPCLVPSSGPTHVPFPALIPVSSTPVNAPVLQQVPATHPGPGYGIRTPDGGRQLHEDTDFTQNKHFYPTQLRKATHTRMQIHK